MSDEEPSLNRSGSSGAARIVRCVVAAGRFVGRWIAKLLERVGLKSRTPSFRESLKDVLAGGGDDRGIVAFDASERAYLRNVLRLREICVEDVMVPRSEMDAVSSNITLTDFMLFVAQSAHSRIPVYEDKLDDANAMVHIRDVISYIVKASKVGKEVLDLSRLDMSIPLVDTGMLRSVLSVPGSVPITSLLTRMQAERIQIALVIDEFGGVDGLVSLEDIVERVFGSIEDEYDVENHVMMSQVGPSSWVVEGVTSLKVLGDTMGIDFLSIGANCGDVETVGGMVSGLAGCVPSKGAVLRFEVIPRVSFEILETDSRCIKGLIVNLEQSEGRAEKSNTPVPVGIMAGK